MSSRQLVRQPPPATTGPLSRLLWQVRLRPPTRCVVTCSIEPPTRHTDDDKHDDVDYYERPGSIVCIESGFDQRRFSTFDRGSGVRLNFSSSLPLPSLASRWSQYFPKKKGLYFCAVDVFGTGLSPLFEERKTDDKNKETESLLDGRALLHDCESELASDIMTLSGPILVAIGTVPCLIAQYYLESHAVSGVVLINPILPAVAGGDDSSKIAKTRFMDFVSKHLKEINDGEIRRSVVERTILEWLARGGNDRPLKLEKGAVPMLVICSDGAEERYRQNAQDTAAFHSDVEGPWGAVELFSDISCGAYSSFDTLADVLADEITRWKDEKVI